MNSFDEVYRAKKLGKLDEVLRLLIDRKTGGLRAPYRTSANHSWYAVGDILFLKMDYKNAVIAFKKALRSRTDDYQALWAIANCYSCLTKPVFAERYFRKAIQYAPKEEHESLRYDLGNALFDQQNYAEAIRLYTSIKKANLALYKKAQKNVAIAKERVRLGSEISPRRADE